MFLILGLMQAVQADAPTLIPINDELTDLLIYPIFENDGDEQFSFKANFSTEFNLIKNQIATTGVQIQFYVYRWWMKFSKKNSNQGWGYYVQFSVFTLTNPPTLVVTSKNKHFFTKDPSLPPLTGPGAFDYANIGIQTSDAAGRTTIQKYGPYKNYYAKSQTPTSFIVNIYTAPPKS